VRCAALHTSGKTDADGHAIVPQYKVPRPANKRIQYHHVRSVLHNANVAANFLHLLCSAAGEHNLRTLKMTFACVKGRRPWLGDLYLHSGNDVKAFSQKF
jgi:hypothetical protein